MNACYRPHRKTETSAIRTDARKLAHKVCLFDALCLTKRIANSVAIKISKIQSKAVRNQPGGILAQCHDFTCRERSGIRKEFISFLSVNTMISVKLHARFGCKGKREINFQNGIMQYSSYFRCVWSV